MIDSAKQIRNYEELFKKKNYKVADILYQAWLLFKWDSIGSEEEAFNHVLKKRKPANLEAKKKRERVAPEGPARYNMNDPSWTPILEERKDKEAKNKKKANDKGKLGRSRTVAPSTVTSGALESNSSVPGLQLPIILAPFIEDNSCNSKSRSRSKKTTAASCTVSSEALDVESELPDIPEPNLSNRGKRKRGNHNNSTSSKCAKLKSNREEINGTGLVTSTEIIPSGPKFPLENGLAPLINDDDDDDDETSCDITNGNAGNFAVVSKSKISTFLDIDLDLDTTNIQELKVSRKTKPVSMINDTVNNNSNSKSTRASRMRSRGKHELSSDTVKSKTASTASATSTSPSSNNNNNVNMKMKVKSKEFSAASHCSTPMTTIDAGEQINDQNLNKINEITTMKLKAQKRSKVNLKKGKK